MKLKFDDKGMPALADVNGEKMPIYVHDDGKEAPLDVRALMSSLNSRIEQNKRIEAEMKELRQKLQAFSGIDDPSAAMKAMEVVKGLEQGQLIKAGEVERVKSEIAKSFEAKMSEIAQERDLLRDELYNEKVGGAFMRSKAISEKFAIPADLVQARFGNNFGIEGGKIYAVDNAGNKIYSRTKPGELADFDEALMTLVEQYPYKDSILKGSGSSGGGASAGGSNGGYGRTMTLEQLNQMKPAERAKVMASGATIVDS